MNTEMLDMLDKAFEALKTYDWGTDRNAAQADRRRGGRHARRRRRPQGTGDPPGRRAEDRRLARRQGLRLPQADGSIGTAESVPALAALLPDKDLSHMARYALERIPAPEAGAALRDALPKLSGALKVGVIGSLGVRRDAASVAGPDRPAGRRRRGDCRRGRHGPGRHRHARGRQGPGRRRQEGPRRGEGRP